MRCAAAARAGRETAWECMPRSPVRGAQAAKLGRLALASRLSLSAMSDGGARVSRECGSAANEFAAWYRKHVKTCSASARGFRNPFERVSGVSLSAMNDGGARPGTGNTLKRVRGARVVFVTRLNGFLVSDAEFIRWSFFWRGLKQESLACSRDDQSAVSILPCATVASS